METLIEIGINKSGVDSGKIDYNIKHYEFKEWFEKLTDSEVLDFYNLIERLKDTITDNYPEPLTEEMKAGIRTATLPKREG